MRLVQVLLLLILLYTPSLQDEVYQNDLYTEKLSREEEKPLIDYLGLTYDIILGNPYGDPKLVSDLGFKRYVLKWENGKGDYSSFKSKELLCYYTKSPSIIKNLDDLSIEFSQYNPLPQYDIHVFNGSNYYKMLANRFQRGDLVVIFKNMCSKYFVSLNESYKDNIDPFFLNLIKEVAEFYKGIKDEKSKCDVHMYKRYKNSEACEKNIKPWIAFFNLYGTHLVTGAYFGGKIINTLYAENYNILRDGSGKLNLNTKRLDPFFKNEGDFYYGTIVTANKTIFLKENHLILHGGMHMNATKSSREDSYYKWKQSIEGNLAKPIRIILTPFADFIDSEDGQAAYYEALEFYSNLTYTNYNNTIYEFITTEKELYTAHIRNWKQTSAKNDNFNVSLKCSSPNDNMISGFIVTKISTRYGPELLLHLCPFSNNCISDVVMEQSNSYEFGWALCTQKKFLNEMKQLKYITKGNAKFSCPAKMKIAFGFILNVKKGITGHVHIEPCISNETECASTHKNKDEQTLIWINCVPDNEIGLLSSLEVKTFSKRVILDNDASYSLSCTDGYFIISGFSVDLANSERGEGKVCSIGSSSCKLDVWVDEKNSKEIHTPTIFIVCSSL